MPLTTPASRAVVLMLFCAALAPGTSFAQSTEISTEFLMTLYAPLNTPQAIDESLLILSEVRFFHSPLGQTKRPVADIQRLLTLAGLTSIYRSTADGRSRINETVFGKTRVLVSNWYGAFWPDPVVAPM